MSTEDGNYNWSLLATQGREQHPGEPLKYITPYTVTLYSQWANIFQNNLRIAFIQLMEKRSWKLFKNKMAWFFSVTLGFSPASLILTKLSPCSSATFKKISRDFNEKNRAIVKYKYTWIISQIPRCEVKH